MISFATQGASVIIGLASTIVLARLLSPDDYGVMAMVVAVTAFAGLFRDLGLSSAAIQKQTLTNAQQSNLFWINVALGSTLTVLLAACAPLVAWFYGKPEVLWVTVALSASFIISSFGTQSGALLVREIRSGRDYARGFFHFNPGNRAKSTSVVCRTRPRSIANAARCASVVRLPAVPICSNKPDQV